MINETGGPGRGTQVTTVCTAPADTSTLFPIGKLVPTVHVVDATPLAFVVTDVGVTVPFPSLIEKVTPVPATGVSKASVTLTETGVLAPTVNEVERLWTSVICFGTPTKAGSKTTIVTLLEMALPADAVMVAPPILSPAVTSPVLLTAATVESLLVYVTGYPINVVLSAAETVADS